ncbi:MAG: M48 family metallopeptidase [Pseudomonadota bacterium]
MTASPEHDTLEGVGRYFDGESARSQEVIIGFGKRSIVIFQHGDQAIAHWPLGALRATRGGGIGELTLMPGHDSDEQLVIDDPTMIGIIKKVCPDLYRKPRGGAGMRKAVVWAGLASGSVAAIIFVLIPAMAVQLAPLIPYERERAMGDATMEQLSTIMARGSRFDDGICDGPRGLAALEKMTARLEPHSNIDRPIQVDVIDASIPNAFAAPGGRMALTRGLLSMAETPEEVAGVLAHEMGHDLHRDPMVGLLRQAGSTGVLSMLIGDVVGAGIFATVGDAAIYASYSQMQERRADDEAIRILQEAELPTRPFGEFFERLREESGETPSVLQFLSTHPTSQSRAEKVLSLEDRTNYTPVLTDSEWVALQNVCSETF